MSCPHVKTLSKGQIVIPAEIRKKHHIETGTEMQIMEIRRHYLSHTPCQRSGEGSLRSPADQAIACRTYPLKGGKAI